MNRTLVAVALAAGCAAPALAQQADYCNRSGYATGVISPQDNNRYQACDPRMVPRVNGVPQEQPAPTARPRYNETQPPPAVVGGGYGPYGGYYYGARGPEWRRGARAPREYRGRQYQVDDWRAHRLSPPPRGYHWVQVGRDYALVQNGSGVIGRTIIAP